MKLRFDKNSLRLRVKKSDIEKLREKNSIHEVIAFPNGSFVYKLLLSDDLTEMAARIQDQSIEVIIPAELALAWMNNDETGLYRTALFNNQQLDIIVEKDFPCKNRPEEDSSDSFSEPSTLILPSQC